MCRSVFSHYRKRFYSEIFRNVVFFNDKLRLAYVVIRMFEKSDMLTLIMNIIGIHTHTHMEFIIFSREVISSVYPIRL